MNNDAFREMLALLQRLQAAKIAHRLYQCREDALMIEVSIPGERWEIEFVDYDDEVHVEIEKFRSDGEMFDEEALHELFVEQSDADTPVIS
jgi:hypothetical protein